MKKLFNRDIKALYTDDNEFLVVRDDQDCFYYFKRTQEEHGLIYHVSDLEDVKLIEKDKKPKPLRVVFLSDKAKK